MNPITAREQLEQVRAHLVAAEENLGNAVAAAEFTRRRVDAMLAHLRVAPVRVTVDPVTLPS